MPNTRVNITLPTDVVDDIKAFYGARGVSRFIEEAAREKIAELKARAYAGLIEGYRARADETAETLRRFDGAVTEKRRA